VVGFEVGTLVGLRDVGARVVGLAVVGFGVGLSVEGLLVVGALEDGRPVGLAVIVATTTLSSVLSHRVLS
jgi:hypothetical protein